MKWLLRKLKRWLIRGSGWRLEAVGVNITDRVVVKLNLYSSKLSVDPVATSIENAYGVALMSL